MRIVPRSCIAFFASFLVVPATVLAGGGPLNVMVIYNADEPEAVSVADHYAAARSLPMANRCGISGVDPLQTTMPFSEYETSIHLPVEACLDASPYRDELDYLVLVRGLPYRIELEGANAYMASLSAVLQVHRAARPADGLELAGQPQSDPGGVFVASISNPAYIPGAFSNGDFTVSNPSLGWYLGATGIVRLATLPNSFRSGAAGMRSGYDFARNLFIVTRLDGFDYTDARDLIDRAIAADESFPVAELLCMEAADEARGARDPECEFVTRHLALAGFDASYLTPHDAQLAGRDLAAYFTGTTNLRNGIDDNNYAPGALADNLTSFGAVPANFFCDATGTTCPENESQTSIARYVRAGVTGAHGTVAEPINNCFPGAGTLLLYTFGYNLGESFFFNQQFLYWQNTYLGDPLTTPYAERPVITFDIDGEHPQGTPLTVSASHPDGIQQIALYVDGVRVFQLLEESIAWPVTEAVGSELELMAFAIANNAPTPRPGWPNPNQEPRPDVQGWAMTTLTVGPPPPPPPPPPEDEPGCACRAAPAGHSLPGYAGLSLAIVLLALRRRAGLARSRSGV